MLEMQSPRNVSESDNAYVTSRGDSGATETTSHRADGPAKIALPDQPWWRTALNSHRSVMLAAFVVVSYASAGVHAIRRDDWPVGSTLVVLAALTVVSLVGWLRPGHRLRRWAIFSLLLLVLAPFAWLYVSR